MLRVAATRQWRGHRHVAYDAASVGLRAAEVRHPMADGTAGNGNAVSATPALGSMAALTNPVWLGR